MLEVEDGGVRGLVEDGSVERILETLDRKKLLKASARAEGSSCEGKERVVLLLSKSLLKVLRSFC